MKNVFYGVLVVFLILAGIAAYTFWQGMNRAETAVQSVGDLVQQLVVPATAVILPDASIIVNQVQDIARLETATVEIEKVVSAERNSEAFFGQLGESMIFVANGTIVAGIDFAELEEGDIQVVDPNTVWVHLPQAAIFDDLPVLNEEESYVADRDTGLFTRADPELETDVRRVAAQAIREDALATGVVETAEQNAEIFVENFLTGLGFTEIIFFDDTPPVPEPYVQDVPKGQVLVTPQP